MKKNVENLEINQWFSTCLQMKGEEIFDFLFVREVFEVKMYLHIQKSI